VRPNVPPSLPWLLAALLPLAACDSDTDPADDDTVDEADDDATPEPEPEPNPFIGRSYLLDMASVTVIEPEGGDVLLSLLEGEFLLLSVTGGEDASIDMAVTLAAVEGKSVEQDACAPIVEMPDGLYGIEDRSVAIGPADFAVSVDPGIGVEIDFVLHAFALSGVFSPSGASIDGVSFQGTVDLRDYQELLDALIGEGLDACDFLAFYVGLQCTACDDGAEQCVDLEVTTDYIGEWGGTFSLQPEEPEGGC